ncbi:MAG TPA: hypothetical protein VIK61_13995, partial [Acidimicrobiia bacterium]
MSAAFASTPGGATTVPADHTATVHRAAAVRPAAPGSVGYDIVDTAGGVHPFGAAVSYGNLLGRTLSAPILGIAQTVTKKGYWLVGSDGGIFSFGDAKFYGSTGATLLNKTITGIEATPTGKGYWLVAGDGGIFSFGDAKFYGSTGA